MKKKIAILGSTGSIGKSIIKILKRDYKKVEVVLLTTNKNISELSKQVNFFKVKNVLITDYIQYLKFKSQFKNRKIRIYNDISLIKKLFPKKIDYTMCSITGLDGLQPTLDSIEYSKTVAIANKESIICAWNLIKKKLKKFNTKFIPVDSEHFSLFTLINDYKIDTVDKIFITASGGPFIKYPINRFDKITLSEALKHPNWSMGKKISIDSATLMNKVFEVIEARNIFNISYNKISILTHPKSYVHAIVKFNNGLIKLLIHEPNMEIPIYNSIYLSDSKGIKSNSLDINILNNLEFDKVDLIKFPLVKIIKQLPNFNSLYETILITVNDYFVLKFLDSRINYQELINFIYKYSNLKEFQRYKKISVKKLEEIYKLRNYVSLKLDTLGI